MEGGALSSGRRSRSGVVLVNFKSKQNKSRLGSTVTGGPTTFGVIKDEIGRRRRVCPILIKLCIY